MGKPNNLGQALSGASNSLQSVGALGAPFGDVMIRPGSGVSHVGMAAPQQGGMGSAPPLSRTPGPQLAPQAMNQGLPVNQNALNYLNNWYQGTPSPWGTPAQEPNPYQNNVVPQARTGPTRWDLMSAGTPAPATASLQRPQAPVPAVAPQQQNPNWGALYGSGPNQFAQGFNPLAGNVNGNPPGSQFGPGVPVARPRLPSVGTI